MWCGKPQKTTTQIPDGISITFISGEIVMLYQLGSRDYVHLTTYGLCLEQVLANMRFLEHSPLLHDFTSLNRSAHWSKNLNCVRRKWDHAVPHCDWVRYTTGQRPSSDQTLLQGQLQPIPAWARDRNQSWCTSRAWNCLLGTMVCSSLQHECNTPQVLLGSF